MTDQEIKTKIAEHRDEIRVLKLQLLAQREDAKKAKAEEKPKEKTEIT